jgi:murein DD-endopeptidase MepM/ murein hydrolase activator NlpD
VIDHGWGVYSIYMHQSESKVEPEQEVDTGQVIGLVGASGRVTGAHLHWEIRVGGVPVQPLDWVEQTFP